MRRCSRSQERLAETQKKVDFEAKELASTQAWLQLIETGIAQAEQHHLCFMCERGFTPAEEATFVQSCTHKAKVELPAAEQQKQRDHRAATELMGTLVQARPVWEECQRMQEHDVPQAEEALRTCVACGRMSR